MKQLHKKFTDYQIKELITRYLKKKIARKYIQEILDIKKTRFFALVKRLKDDPENFSILYSRRIPTRKISKDIEKNIVKELKIEKDLIKAKEVPIKYYNYSYIKDLLEQKYSQKISLPTIIDRVKRNNFYFLKPERKVYDKEILNNCPRKLIQHDSSFPQFSPYADSKWYLITSLDYFCRPSPYPDLFSFKRKY